MPKSAESPDSAHTGELGYNFGPFRLDVQRRRLWRGDKHLPLSSRSFDTLLALVQSAGRIIEKDELMRLVWPHTFVVDDNLTQQISSLRKALSDHAEEPTYILTVPRRGYRFLAEVTKLPNGQHEPSSVDGGLASTTALAAPVLEKGTRVPSFALITVTVIVGLLVTATVMIGISRKPSPTFPSAVRFIETPPDGVSVSSGGVISPDGRRLVYVGS